MVSSFKKRLGRTLLNIQGWRTNLRIIIIESDDWGGIRMPNERTRTVYQAKGYHILDNPYCKYDTLANSEDLEKLFGVLSKFKDKNGNHPVLTVNTVVANPNFEQIKASGYSDYSYTPFTTTLKDYYPNENVFALWQEGIEKKIFIPQYHGREHLNVPLWLKILKSDNRAFKDAFDLGFWGLPKRFYDSKTLNVQAAYGSDNEHDIAFYKDSIYEGLNLFEEIFGFRSKTFIANNYTWSPELNSTLKQNGILGFQSMKYQKIPDHEKKNHTRLYSVFTGKKNELNQIYTVRNCVFEPSQMPTHFNNVGNCLKEIENAFFFKKPAIISSHRLNYIGSISQENRDKNLSDFENLIRQIVTKWPDAIFMTSDQLNDLIND